MNILILPIRTHSFPNLRWHWAKKAKVAREQRKMTFFTARMAGIKSAPDGVFTVKLVRTGKRKLDKDNLAASFKYVQDGLAAAMCIDDGDDRIDWQYSQEVGKEYSVKITIEG